MLLDISPPRVCRSLRFPSESFRTSDLPPRPLFFPRSRVAPRRVASRRSVMPLLDLISLSFSSSISFSLFLFLFVLSLPLFPFSLSFALFSLSLSSLLFLSLLLVQPPFVSLARARCTMSPRLQALRRLLCLSLACRPWMRGMMSFAASDPLRTRPRFFFFFSSLYCSALLGGHQSFLLKLPSR